MAKAIKTTTLNFGLVTTPVSIKTPGTSSKTTTKLQMASPDGNHVKQQYVDETTGEIVGTVNDCQRGIFVGDEFAPVPKEALDAIDAELAVESVAIRGTMTRDETPWERSTKSYYIVPGAPGAAPLQALALLRDTLVKFDKVGYGEATIAKVTHPFIVHAEEVKPGEVGLFLTMQAYASEFNDATNEAGSAFAGVETAEATLGMAGALIDQLESGREAFDKLTDTRTEKRSELISLAAAGKKITAPKVEPKVEAPVADLSELLAASIAQAAGDKPKAKGKGKKAVAAA